ncbi:MAG: enoyl-CoA hydratase/isomerase family protein [Nostocoides sp.]
MSTVDFDIADDVATIRLNRPESLNAMNDDMLLRDLPGAVEECARAARVIVVAAAGTTFCAGADLAQASAWNLREESEAVQWVREACRAARLLLNSPVPTIAAVDGHAVGGGFGLAAACDLRIVGPSAQFWAPFVSLGLVPDFGLTYSLPRIVGPSRALDILVTGSRVSATEAQAMGLATRISPEPEAAATQLAHEIAALSPGAVAGTRANMWAGLRVDAATEIDDYEAVVQGRLLVSEDVRNRVRGYRAQVKEG